MSSCEIIEGITLHHGDCRDIMRALPAGIEDAGFAIRDAMAWIRADGKPSGVDLSAAFDRAAGVLNQRKGRDIREWADKATATRMCSHKVYGAGEPVTDEAKAWAGWGVGLKPAWEPIVVARRPLEIHERFRCGIDAPLDILI